MEADILVPNSDGKSILVVEAKNRQNLSASVASALRRNLAVHNLVPPSAYFLLASQEFGYLWKAADLSMPDTPPTAQFSMADIIARCFPGAGPEDRLRKAELEMLLLQWLQDLAGPNGNAPVEPEATLARTGLLEDLQGTTVDAHAKS